jgi:hypothetical protein
MAEFKIDTIDNAMLLKAFIEHVTSPGGGTGRLLGKDIASALDISPAQITRMGQFMCEKLGGDWYTPAKGSALLGFCRRLDMLVESWEGLNSVTPAVTETLTALTTPAVLTSFMPHVCEVLLTTCDWSTKYRSKRLRVEVWNDMERALERVVAGSAACMFIEDEAVPGAVRADPRFERMDVFGVEPFGFVYKGFEFPEEIALRPNGCPDLGFLADKLVWAPRNCPSWKVVQSLLPPPEWGGCQFDLYTFNSVRAAIKRNGGVGVGTAWPTDSPWGQDNEIGFYPFSDLPGTSAPVQELKRHNNTKFQLYLRHGWCKAADEPGAENALSPAGKRLIKAILKAGENYRHPFVS